MVEEISYCSSFHGEIYILRKVKRSLLSRRLARLNRIDFFLAELATFECTVARLGKRDGGKRAETHLAGAAFDLAINRITHEPAGCRVTFSHPITEDPGFGTTRRDLQIKPAAVAICAGSLFPRDVDRLQFSGDQIKLPELSAQLVPETLPANKTEYLWVAANCRERASLSISQEVTILKGFLERWRTKANGTLAEGV
jgi:hypothetical protein